MLFHPSDSEGDKIFCWDQFSQALPHRPLDLGIFVEVIQENLRKIVSLGPLGNPIGVVQTLYDLFAPISPKLGYGYPVFVREVG
jgi:hypothetical protein